MRVTKPDSQSWLQICPQLISSLLADDLRESNDAEIIAEARRLAVQRYFDRPLFVTLRLAIEYALPNAPSAAPDSNNNPPPAFAAAAAALASGGNVISIGGGPNKLQRG